MDEGLLGGLAEGIQSGLSSYKDARQAKMQREDAMEQRKRQALQDAMAQRQMSLSEKEKGMEYDPESGQYSLSKQAVVDKQNKEFIDAAKSGARIERDQNDPYGKITGYREMAKPKAPLGLLEQTLLDEKVSKAMQDRKDREFKATPQGKIASLNTEAKARFDNARGSLDAIRQMGNALVGENQNTFSPIGDNDFTRNRDLFTEYLGRMQSGGAIGIEEQKKFEKLIPRITDNAETQKKKIAQLEKEMTDRLRTLGTSEEEAEKAGYSISKFSPDTEQKITGLLPKVTPKTPEDIAAIDWAKKNPADPRAKDIFKKNGIDPAKEEVKNAVAR